MWERSQPCDSADPPRADRGGRGNAHSARTMITTRLRTVGGGVGARIAWPQTPALHRPAERRELRPLLHQCDRDGREALHSATVRPSALSLGDARGRSRALSWRAGRVVLGCTGRLPCDRRAQVRPPGTGEPNPFPRRATLPNTRILGSPPLPAASSTRLVSSARSSWRSYSGDRHRSWGDRRALVQHRSLNPRRREGVTC